MLFALCTTPEISPNNKPKSNMHKKTATLQWRFWGFMKSETD